MFQNHMYQRAYIKNVSERMHSLREEGEKKKICETCAGSENSTKTRMSKIEPEIYQYQKTESEFYACEVY